ncbi:cytochrome c oxidase subunit 7C, mitochondrial [Drosophila elegans]|uniref:cytochrome c oxidase subunit 7C, mitochondrial n=1 Tax=Drosophila elegans TaxID=30023 RepID=UPI0007E73478|nr:cytochrome c oxidase subunit 7C, mitochondrial [Drosophila elegans]XP_017120456.1 cytochrome c oxidase subunit 7C, mitochondrial [Drosophila elegans]XP_017120457.1 cytochrome c oxidase subunit 7C, mitochondrial [Drosophila elegans]XP_017120458.1 cytochrome c oxidase subunit 7C, mitochondrial [Drosophila elegans]XP_041563500.1 cytochrome c oxidase subunit 7C, mitochondrial [Drosophila elegans]
MWSTLRKPVAQFCKPLKRYGHGYSGGCPGANLPFGLDSPMRFTVCYLIAGVVGFGAPFLVIRHQMLRNVTEDPKEEE